MRACARVSIRLPGVVGPGSHDNFLSDTMTRLVAGETAVVRNPDALFNNVVHVDDFACFADTLLASLPPGHRADHDWRRNAAANPRSCRDPGGRGGAQRRGPLRAWRPSVPDLQRPCPLLGYRPATVRDSVERFARARAAETAAVLAGPPRAGDLSR